MKDNWFRDMVETLIYDKISRPVSERYQAGKQSFELRKTQQRLNQAKRERDRYEGKLQRNKMLKHITSSGSVVLILWLVFNFSFLNLFASMAIIGLVDSVSSENKKLLKKRLERTEEEIRQLETRLQALEGDAPKVDPYTGKEYVEAQGVEVVEEEEEAQCPIDPDEAERIPEAVKAFRQLEELPDIIKELASHDYETAKLFENSFKSAGKVAQVIQGRKEIENRAYLYYNNVDTLYEWSNNLLDLERKDVYDSLLVNLRAKAQKALPVLQHKFDAEYYRLVNPTIRDLEAEMDVMSKEVY